MATTMSLSQMTDLALGTPEVGAVNFSVMHTLMHAILTKLNIADEKAVISKDDQEFLTTPRSKKPEEADADGFSDKDSAITGFTDSTDRTADQPKKGQEQGQDAIPYKKSPYHELENKVDKMQEQIDRFNALPSNDELKNIIQQGDSGNPRPVTDMWQNMQLKNRVDANENGISKMASLMEDLMNDVQKLKDENGDLKKQMEDAGKMKDVLDELKRLQDLIDELKQKQKEMADKLDLYPDPEALNDFVTWEGLENALRGVREELQPKDNIVIEQGQQTTPIQSRPPSRRASTPGPSSELLDILERLGILTEKHDKLEVRVDKIEEELKNKADKTDLEGLGGVPGDLLERLDKIGEDIEELQKLKDRDSDALSRLHQALFNLQTELERVSKQCQHLIEENSVRIRDIDGLTTVCKELDDTKADKEWTQNRLDVKADKKQLEHKVNKTLFDETVEELNKMINDVLSKLKECDCEWKDALAKMTEDLDGKLDRLEFGPIKDEIERQLRALMRKINALNSMQQQHDPIDDDAAGIRKQLVQRFHCISCDRPVDMVPHGPIPSIPQTQGLPATRSSRPYTTYELDQIRQHAKSSPDGMPFIPLNQTPTSMSMSQQEVTELFNNRSCGGSHTMTFPHRRITRTQHMNNMLQDEEDKPVRDEGQVQGVDGHIYKGRKQTPDKLPNLQGGKSEPKLGRRARTDMGIAEPAPPISPRPSSARLSRPNTAGGQPSPPRPGSALQESELPPPPAPTEFAIEQAPVEGELQTAQTAE